MIFAVQSSLGGGQLIIFCGQVLLSFCLINLVWIAVALCDLVHNVETVYGLHCLPTAS